MMADTREYCEGRLEVLFASESSYRCTVCGWIGWPRTEIDWDSGRILKFYPHLKDPQTERLWRR